MSVHSYDPNTKSLLPIAGASAPATGFTPVGTIISVMATKAPEFYLECNGATYNISDYPKLAQHFEDNFGTKNHFGGDGTTTFAVPDLRGEFLRGTGTNSHLISDTEFLEGSGDDVGVHQDATRIPSVWVWNSGVGQRLIVGEIQTTDLEKGNAVKSPDSIISSGEQQRIATKVAGEQVTYQTTNSTIDYTSRPTNTSVLYCIAVKDIYIELSDDRPVQAAMDRWLRFDPTNHKGLIIKAGTSILKADKTYKTFLYDTKVDFTNTITNSDNGKDFFVYLMNDDSIIASKTTLLSGVKIGRFHTLCVNAGSNLTMIAPAPLNCALAIGDGYLVKSYKADEDPDFYMFYNKAITAKITGTSQYDTITCEHPLSGYLAGDILPESVFCKTFYPDCLTEDAMVYDKDTDICVDVYLQSGTDYNTRSAYGATHTVSRSPWNHAADFRQVGKRFISDFEYTSIALGSNEKTNIKASSVFGTTGGHLDTNDRRMISAIGVEDCCGYRNQWIGNAVPAGGSSFVDNSDGEGSFGQEYGDPYVMLAGGHDTIGVNGGSRHRASDNVRKTFKARITSRGCTSIIKSASAPKYSSVPKQTNYSTDEQIVGTWIDGKPLYQKTFVLLNNTYPASPNTDTYIPIVDDSTLELKYSYSFYQDTKSTDTDSIITLPHVAINASTGIPYIHMEVKQRKLDNNSKPIVLFIRNIATASFTFNLYATLQYTKTTD